MEKKDERGRCPVCGKFASGSAIAAYESVRTAHVKVEEKLKSQVAEYSITLKRMEKELLRLQQENKRLRDRSFWKRVFNKY